MLAALVPLFAIVIDVTVYVAAVACRGSPGVSLLADQIFDGFGIARTTPSTLRAPDPSPTRTLWFTSTDALTPDTGSSMATFENVSTAHTVPGTRTTATISMAMMTVSCRPVNGPHVFVG